MKDTMMNREAVELMAEAASRYGYEMNVRKYPGWTEGYISLSITSPQDTKSVDYPEIFFSDDWYGIEEIRFDILDTGNGDNSVAQAKRVVAGLNIAIEMVELMLDIAESKGLKVRRD